MSVYSLDETTIFSAVTAAVSTAVPLDLRLENKQIPVTIMAKGLAGAETVSIWFSVDAGVTYTEYMEDSGQLILTANDNIKACYSGVYLGFTKSSSASPVTVLANVRTRGN